MKTIGVIGAGTMGGGIAQLAALSRFHVILHDVSPPALTAAMQRIRESLQSAAKKNAVSATAATEALAAIHPRRSLNDFADADIVIEAAPEDLQIKQELFKRLDTIVGRDTILASNTSSLSITAIGAVTRSPESVIGMHFFNPATTMKLVEIVRGAKSSDRSVAAASALAGKLGKVPVVCRDTPGFIVNRLARPFYGEALRLLGDGVATVEEIDRIVSRGGGFRMGPFALMDLIGIDVNYAVTRSVYEQFFHEPRFRPHPIQRRMVEAGTLGRKTGQGFYRYTQS